MIFCTFSRVAKGIVNYQPPRKELLKIIEITLKLDLLLMTLARCVKRRKLNMTKGSCQPRNRNQGMVGSLKILKIIFVVKPKQLVGDLLQPPITRKLRSLIIILLVMHQIPILLQDLVGLTIVIQLQMGRQTFISPDFPHHGLAITAVMEWEEIMIMIGSTKPSWAFLPVNHKKWSSMLNDSPDI